MKTPPASTLQRTETGAYVGAVSSGGLTDEQKKKIRRILTEAHEPLMIGTIAARAGIELNTPMAQNSVAHFISDYLVVMKEVERVAEGTNKRTGRSIFKGYIATQHGKDLVSKGLA